MVLLIIIPTKWLFHWEYTQFSDTSMCFFWSSWEHSKIQWFGQALPDVRRLWRLRRGATCRSLGDLQLPRPRGTSIGGTIRSYGRLVKYVQLIQIGGVHFSTGWLTNRAFNKFNKFNTIWKVYQEVKLWFQWDIKPCPFLFKGLIAGRKSSSENGRSIRSAKMGHGHPPWENLYPLLLRI